MRAETVQRAMSKADARRLLLIHQGLWPARRLSGKNGVLDHFRHIGTIQYDPLNRVGHNPELVLQSRVQGFRPEMLNELLYIDRQLIDGWDKVMSIYPVEDWPFFARVRDHARKRYNHDSRPAVRIVPEVRSEIAKRGPLSSIDLHFDERVDWAWAPTTIARAALESMYLWGELVVHHRVRARKVYDFAARHLPAHIIEAPEPNPDETEYQDWRVLRRIQSIGLVWNRAGDAWGGMHGIKSPERANAISRLLADSKLIRIAVEGIDSPLYTVPDAFTRYLSETSGHTARASVIAPLDNVLWDRKLIRSLFDFDYTWEVYKPAHQRLHGYYVLPVLYGDRFVARCEPVMDRKRGVLVIKNWWWEKGISRTKAMERALTVCMRSFLAYLGTQELELCNGLSSRDDLSWIDAFKPGNGR